MRLLVCGGRDYHRIEVVYATLDEIYREHEIELLIHGGASGADALAGSWALERDIPVREFLAEWSLWGGRAGNMRNSKMLREGKPHMVVAFPGGSGTRDMVRKARLEGIPVEIIAPVLV